MGFSKNNLIWIDLEMTGLDTFNDQIIEIATIVTNDKLEILAEGPNLAIQQPESVLMAMDEWNKTHHGNSGLLTRVRNSTVTLALAERETLNFLEQWVPCGVSPMCGNSICQDRRFLARLMPKLESFFNYRSIDVSTLKELARRLVSQKIPSFCKESQHLALADIRDSIAELRHYRQHFLRC
ncbi:oligoribonuclease [Achromatium sp. WMS2]|nr:oligoribonuclease [Achromatium sp. WMS2]